MGVTLRALASLCGAAILALSAALHAQDTPKPAYDVSTLKPHALGDNNHNWNGLPNGVNVTNISLRNLIAAAWDLRPDQVTGGPDWVRDLAWDFTAKSTDGGADELKKMLRDDRLRMLQAVLTERLGLKVHTESRMASIYTLLPAKAGIKLQPLVLAEGEKAAGSMGVSSSDATMKLSGHGANMHNILRTLENNTGKTIVDKTGLPHDAIYNIELRFLREGATAPADEGEPPPPLPTALEEQLGLHLEAGRGPEPVLVIDAVTKPAAN